MQIFDSLRERFSNNQIPDLFSFVMMTLLFLVFCALLSLIFVGLVAGVCWVIGQAIVSLAFWRGLALLTAVAMLLAIYAVGRSLNE